MLTPKRLRACTTLLAVTLWSIWAIDMSNAGPIDRLGKVKGTDFLHFYVIGSVAREGRWRDLYDARAQLAHAQAIAPGSRDTLFVPVESPQLALAFAPLAACRYVTAFALWLIGTLFVYAVSCLVIWMDSDGLRRERRAVAVACAAFPGFYSLVLHGQTSALSLLCLAAAVWCLRRRFHLAAGLAIGSLVYKPHWVAAAVAVMFVAREWRVLFGTAAAAAGQITIAWLALGSAVMGTYWRMLRALPQLARMLEPKPSESLEGLFKTVLPSAPAAAVAYCAGALVTSVMAARLWRSRAPFEIRASGIILAVVLVSPHVGVYDLILLGPVFLMLADWISSNRSHLHTAMLTMFLSVLFVAPLLSMLPAILRLQCSVTSMAAILLILSRVGRSVELQAGATIRRESSESLEVSV